MVSEDHPISRQEARNDLKLKVKDPDPAVEELMWKAFGEYERDLDLNSPFQPLHEFDSRSSAAPAGAPITTQTIVQQIIQLGQNGVSLGQISAQQMVDLAVAMLPIVGQPPHPKRRVEMKSMRGAILESSNRTDVFLTDLAIERTTVASPSGPQDAIRQEILWQRWEKEG